MDLTEAGPGAVQERAATRAGQRWFERRLGALALAATVFLVGLVLAQSPGYKGDTEHYKYWTRQVTLNGIQSAYSGTYPIDYAIYPPLTLYLFNGVGHLYTLTENPAFQLDQALQSRWLSFLLKVPGLFFHALLVLTIALLLQRDLPAKAALLAAALYGFNPGVLFDVTYWGQPDPVHSLFLVLSLAGMAGGQMGWAWAAFALAALTKPQAWPLALVLAFVTHQRSGRRGLALGAVQASAMGLVVIWPFIYFNTLQNLLTLPGSMSEVMPFASVNAHNLWWLLTGAPKSFVPDQLSLLGPLTYRTAGFLLVGAFALLTLYRLRIARSQGVVYEAAAYLSFAFFLFATRTHENHAFLALPLLALVLPTRPYTRAVFGVLSLTFLLNLILHDPPTVEAIGSLFSAETLTSLQLGNAVANLGLFGFWTWKFAGTAVGSDEH